MIVKDKKYVLFARAEQFVSVESLDKIWNLDLFCLLNSISESRIYLVIDALEFIADKNQRYSLLIQLYDLAHGHNNVTIITTCRTSDGSAFLQLESNYGIKSFEVEAISPLELDDISSKFETIRIMRKTGQYSELLQSPFYINIIVRNNIKLDDIKDQISFREIIYGHL